MDEEVKGASLRGWCHLVIIIIIIYPFFLAFLLSLIVLFNDQVHVVLFYAVFLCYFCGLAFHDQYLESHSRTHLVTDPFTQLMQFPLKVLFFRVFLVFFDTFMRTNALGFRDSPVGLFLLLPIQGSIRADTCVHLKLFIYSIFL